MDGGVEPSELAVVEQSPNPPAAHGRCRIAALPRMDCPWHVHAAGKTSEGSMWHPSWWVRLDRIFAHVPTTIAAHTSNSLIQRTTFHVESASSMLLRMCYAMPAVDRLAPRGRSFAHPSRPSRSQSIRFDTISMYGFEISMDEISPGDWPTVQGEGPAPTCKQTFAARPPRDEGWRHGSLSAANSRRRIRSSALPCIPAASGEIQSQQGREGRRWKDATRRRGQKDSIHQSRNREAQ